ncbi:MAG: hypothetical protein ACRD4K_01625 [Candidatus Acidiferrales bacterium]
MTKQKIAVFFVCAVLAASSLAQKPPAKKSAGAASGGGTMPGTEQWMDIPAPAMVGTPAVEVGGTLRSRSCKATR